MSIECDIFTMRVARKSSLYRNEVTEAAVIAVGQVLTRFEHGNQKSEI